MIRDERNWEEFELAAPPAKYFKRQCHARDANSGLRCGLLEHGPQTDHSTPRGPFRSVLQPGQDSKHVLELAYLATSGSGL